MDRRFTDTPVKQSPIEFSTSSSAMTTEAATVMMLLMAPTIINCTIIRPLQQDACAPSSSMAMQGSSASVQSIATSDRVTTSFPRGGQSSASTPTRSTGANGNHHTFSPAANPAMSLVVIPIVEKKRQAQRESHHAYFKSNSDYNRAEIKYVSIEAELRLAEFWLEIMTKNLEDVGKRIEVHDWNFQKIISQDESNVA
ncbi:unnamed protein product [Peronospora destructor]|uniref:Uncharacterized protein n=1 Tax=Peronospora destructor TaxID=86335 RepID=A0AAV0VB84_9STRA|nr:unnamed protein product [Peronospora destructor]